MFALIGNFGPWEVGFILLIILIIFGPGKLPKVGESLGKAIRGFRKSVDADEKHEIN
jgi:sec-independent protein translocase protein TatA